MTKSELIDAFWDECSTMAALVAAKNKNYSGANGAGAFSNFDQIESLTNNHITREEGVFVRMTDKLSRLWALLSGNPDQVGEPFGDTCIDLAAYAILLKLMYTESQNERLEAYRGATQSGLYAQAAAQAAQMQTVEEVKCSLDQAAGSVKPPSAWERLTGAMRA